MLDRKETPFCLAPMAAHRGSDNDENIFPLRKISRQVCAHAEPDQNIA